MDDSETMKEYFVCFSDNFHSVYGVVLVFSNNIEIYWDDGISRSYVKEHDTLNQILSSLEVVSEEEYAVQKIVNSWKIDPRRY